MSRSSAAAVDVVYIQLFVTFLTMLTVCEGSSNTQAFCQSETFRPRCLPAEAVIITKAVYGRMLHDSRCLRDEEELPALRDDPKYMGCFEDVLPLVSARCSGQSDCEIRIPDPEMEQSNPCYKNMIKYLVVTYRCITVTQSDRACHVAVTTDKVFLSPFVSSDGSTDVACGSRDRPWLLEAPSGQRVNISLLDFSGSSSSTSSVQRARTVETTSSSRCVRQFGFIEDKSANRNVDICSDAAHRQQTLYVSRSNTVAIVTESASGKENQTNKFLIGFIAVGCSDLVPPSDAWLKRIDNVATVGCYMTRQMWILTCDQTGRWTGTFGNCTQQLLEAYGHGDKADVDVQPQKLESALFSGPMLLLAGITALSIIVCLVILSVGISWICRYRKKHSRNLQSKDLNDDLISHATA